MKQIQDRDVQPEYRKCRSWGHAWDYTTVQKQGVIYLQGLVCLRCTAERYVKINSRSGVSTGGRYSYPDGYLFKGGGALTPEERGELRLAEIQGHIPTRRGRKT